MGGIVSDAIAKGLLPEYDLIGVYSRTAAKAECIVEKMQKYGKNRQMSSGMRARRKKLQKNQQLVN